MSEPSNMNFLCEICASGFMCKKYLTQHKNPAHGIKPDIKTGGLLCDVCGKVFPSQKTLTNHTASLHREKKPSIECKEDNCDEKFHTLSKLRNHLSRVHGILNMEVTQNLEFVKYEDFNEWLAEEEKRSSTKYIVSSRNFKNGVRHTTTFSCNRSGVYKTTVDDRQRQLKAQGTRKIGYHCTSSIHVKEEPCSKILVTYFKGHYKHTKDLCHIPIPKIDKEIIAGKLLQGVEKKRIISEIRESCNGIIEPKHLITRKDVSNIEQQFGHILSSKGSVIKNDESSVCAWVEQMKEEEFNPVQFCKRQDDEHPVIEKKDFMIVVMTKFQKNMLIRFGADRVCVDSTHGISGYQFELVTLMVIDEFEEGIPVAFCITSTVDTVNLSYFFNCIKSVLPSLRPSIFMSDDASMFKNAWVNVFGHCDKYLLCAWHVDRAWKNNLNYLKPEIRKDMYQTLKTLMYELNEAKFQEMMLNFREMLQDDENTKRFQEYFVAHYFYRPEVWAYCYRKQAKINTNMHIENFHKSLKHIYLEGKKTKRVDKVLNELMTLVKDKNYDQFIKSVKGKITKRATQHFKRHREGKVLKATFREVSENNWEVTSCNILYVICKKHTCTNTCIIACCNCAICSSAYSCTCHDHEISNFMCKHIHFLIISLNEVNIFTGPLRKPENSVPIAACTSGNGSGKSFSQVRESMLHLILNSLPDNDAIVSNEVMNHINAAKNSVKAIRHLLSPTREKSFTCPVGNLEPANKKVLQQKRFHSVKKPHSRKRLRLSKPSSVETAEKKAILLREVCYSQDGSSDHQY